MAGWERRLDTIEDGGRPFARTGAGRSALALGGQQPDHHGRHCDALDRVECDDADRQILP